MFTTSLLLPIPSLFPSHCSFSPCSDIEKIHDGIGDKVALFIQWISTFFGGFIIGFIKDWRLTLVLIVFTPFLVLCGAAFSVVRVCIYTAHVHACTHELYVTSGEYMYMHVHMNYTMYCT